MNNKMTAAMKIQQFLFSHPIYNWVGQDENEMCVLVVGDDEYAVTFVDSCLQAGQMLTHDLIIVWCTDSEVLKQDYLTARPALSEFVNIDGALDGSNLEIYATIKFARQNDYLESVSEKARYIFASTGDSNLNREIAELYKGAVREECLAAYVDDEEIRVLLSEQKDSQEYVEVGASREMLSSSEELERMAFNTHMAWEGKGNIDIDKAKERFADPYNYGSSVAFVLSIPYKLKSIGIDCSDPYEAARELNDVLGQNAPSAENKVAQLAALEHRRWVIDRLTDGYSPMRNKNGEADYRSCVDRGSVKNKDKKQHPCIVRCGTETPLSTGKYAEDRELWNKRNEFDNELDELDRMSVDMHREMRDATLRLKSHRDSLDKELENLYELVGGISDYAKRNYDRYSFCIKNILDESKPYAAQYETYKKDIITSAEASPKIDRICEKLSKIDKIMFPALENCLYRDYKKYDEDLIREIPYILTFRSEPVLGAVFNCVNNMTGDNHYVFRNVAAATALYSKEIYYLYYFDEKTNISLLKSKIKAVQNYFLYRGIKSELHFRAYYLSDCKAPVSDLDAVFSELSKEKVIIEGQSKCCASCEDISRDGISWIKDKCDYFDGTNTLFNSPAENKGFIETLFDEEIPYFEFDSKSQAFKHCICADELNYYNVSSFIQVEDMFALMNAEDKEFNYPDFADSYMDYWDVYSGKATNIDFTYAAACWTQIAMLLGKKEIVDREIELNAGSDKERSRQEKVIKNMLIALKERGIISKLKFSGRNGKTVVSATLASEKERMMFEKAGNLLETYVYFEACKTGWFDDVQTGYSFKWEKGEVVNELDCVLTKGYSSILVECKSTIKPEEGYYLTLDSLADRFGVGYKKVLVMVTDVNNFSYPRHIARGEQMEIITLSSEKELKMIGDLLRSIMEQ